MEFKKISIILMMAVFFWGGCSHHILVPYENVEKTNSVQIQLVSGRTVEGTILRKEPHQLTLLMKDMGQAVIPKSTVRSIKRKPPVYDDFNRGISEEEIESVKTSKNAVVYGMGGGALSTGVSFFIGSLASKSMDENGGSVLMATTVGGGGIGTILFTLAGKKKDRKVAITKIREKRRSRAIGTEDAKSQSPDGLKTQLEAEKKRHEELRKQRENLLKELEAKKKKKKE